MVGESSPLLEEDSDDASCIMAFKLVVFSPTGTDLEKSLGIGSAEGAGDAWNVGPAYACTGALLDLTGVITLDVRYSGCRERFFRLLGVEVAPRPLVCGLLGVP